MNPGQIDAGAYVRNNIQLVIPRYQRPYEWDAEKWIGLWRDVAIGYKAAAGSGQPARPKHFIGSVILEDAGASPGAVAVRRTVVDGQQRILTLLVIAAAIRDHDAFLANRSIRPNNELRMIQPKYGAAAAAKRVVIEKSYRKVYDSIARGQFRDEVPQQYFDEKLALAYQFFRYQLWLGLASIDAWDPEKPPRPSRRATAPQPGSFAPWGAPETTTPIDLGLLSSAIEDRLTVLEILLDGKNDEEATVIFETMNSKSTPLRQFDRLRNSFFQCMPKMRTNFHADYWEQVEKTLDVVTYRGLTQSPEEQFFYEYMITWSDERPTQVQMHHDFMERAYESLGYPVVKERRFYRDFARPFAESALLYPLALGRETKATINSKLFQVPPAFQTVAGEIMATSGGPPACVLLALVQTRFEGSMSESDLVEAARDLQSFMLRLMLTGEGKFSPLRSKLMNVTSDFVGGGRTLTALRVALREAGWPTNREVLAGVRESKVYSYGGASMFPMLRGIERQLAGAGAHAMPYGPSINDYSVEHVFPQSKTIPPGWHRDLKSWSQPRAVDIHGMAERRHVLGNLTAVTKYDNSKNARKTLAEKQKLIKAVAPLRLNESLLTCRKWTPRQIDARSKYLAEQVLKEWPRR